MNRVLCVCVRTLATHPGFESDEFENHFHSEDSREDHIENVHHIVEHGWLAVVLQEETEGLFNKNKTVEPAKTLLKKMNINK